MSKPRFHVRLSQCNAGYVERPPSYTPDEGGRVDEPPKYDVIVTGHGWVEENPDGSLSLRRCDCGGGATHLPQVVHMPPEKEEPPQ